MTWVLQSAVFHSPSEHTLGGGYFDAEVQFRHVSATNQHVAVVSVFLQADPGKLQSVNNTFLNRLWRGRSLSTLLKTTNMSVDNNLAQNLNPYLDFFPGSQSHFQYVGSSTEPPCTDDWDYFVFENPVSISVSDLQLIRALPRAFKGNYLSPAGDNNRPPQYNSLPVKVRKCEGITINGAFGISSSSSTSNSVTLVVAALAFVLAVLALALVVFTHIKLKLFKDETRRGITARGTYVDYTAHNPINTAA